MTENLPTKDKIIGASLNNLKELVIQLADKGDNVLLIGPRGSGKELFARLYQEGAGRKKEKFAPINCSGIDSSTLISEIFGHKKGSFTDAKTDRKGLISEYGEDGIIFLDEIGDASQSFQAAILRTLQEGDYKPLGSDKFEKLDPDNMRIVAATTNENNVRPELKDRFTSLYISRLSVRISMGDLSELIKAFCQDTKVEYISQEVFKLLKGNSWPGNVRELKRALNDAVLLCKIRNSNIIQIDDLPTLNMDPYPYSYVDNSEKIKISELPSKSEIPPHSFFFKPWTEKREKEPSIPMKNEEAEMLRVMLDSIGSKISYGSRGIIKAIEEFSHSDSKIHTTLRIDFENTIPDEYAELFWEHHVKKGRGGTKLSEHFDGKINRKTASSHLRKAKQRLNKAQGEESD